jgi:hypothetical protein
MVIRSLISAAATLALPTVYYPFDVSLGVRFDTFGALYFPSEALNYLTVPSQVAANNIATSIAAFRDIVTAMFAVAYIWLGALGAIIVGTLKPEFSMTKRVVISAVSVGVTLLLLLLLVGVV